jgi:hypothetical protein
MKYHLVVAKYNEDLSWLASVDTKWEKVIYNKGPEDGYIKIPNVGREGETYLHYIIDNYDNLPDWVAFCQGNPFDHVSDFIEILNNFQDQVFYRMTHQDVTNSSHCCAVLNTPMHRVFENHKINIPPILNFAAGANFIFPRSAITQNSIDFYKDLTACLNHNSDPIEGHFLERLWSYIFMAKSTTIELI